jgi:hypothetical protein
MALKSFIKKGFTLKNIARRAFSSKVNYEVDESRSQVLIETEELESILGNDNVKVLNSSWYYDNPFIS